MAKLNIEFSKEEKTAMLKAVKSNKGKTISVAALAKEAGLNPNRSRFLIEEMLDEGVIIRTATKAFNPKYVRYSYDIK